VSPAAVVLIALAAIVPVGILLLAIALFIPVICTIDSAKWQMRLRWLAVLEYWRPLPWAAEFGRAGGATGLSLGGMPIQLPARRAETIPAARDSRQEAPSASKESAARTGKPRSKPKKNRARMGRFLLRCLTDSGIRRSFQRNLARFARRALHSASFSRRQVSVSLPDPALNGMLTGFLMGMRGARPGMSEPGRMPRLRINFAGENSAFLEVRLYPYRMAWALLLLPVGLPYLSLLRQWRASSATTAG
jgi:hypothetical protein